MITFANQSYGSHDDGSHEYVEVSFDETAVAYFTFHSLMVNSSSTPSKGKAAWVRQHGMAVEPRFVFSACNAFHTTTHSAMDKEGRKVFVTQTWNNLTGEQCFHLGDKFGRVIARMRRTGYVQAERK